MIPSKAAPEIGPNHKSSSNPGLVRPRPAALWVLVLLLVLLAVKAGEVGGRKTRATGKRAAIPVKPMGSQEKPETTTVSGIGRKTGRVILKPGLMARNPGTRNPVIRETVTGILPAVRIRTGKHCHTKASVTAVSLPEITPHCQMTQW